MKLQNHELIILLPTRNIRNEYAYVKWLNENRIEYKSVKAMRQASGFPSGWMCKGAAFEFEKVEDAMAFKLRWS